MSAGLLVVVVIVIAAATAMYWPVRSAHTTRAHDSTGTDALELARDTKLGELNDLELDFRLGKLSAEDYRALRKVLRSEAVEAIRQIDATTANGRR